MTNAASIGPADIYRQFNLVNGRLVPIPVPAAGQTFPQFSSGGQLNVIPQEFLDHAKRDAILQRIGLTAQSLARGIVEDVTALDRGEQPALDSHVEHVVERGQGD